MLSDERPQPRETEHLSLGVMCPICEATSTTQKNKVRVSRLGRDQTLMLREGDWVELGGTRVS
jgi:hypothetical protein